MVVMGEKKNGTQCILEMYSLEDEQGGIHVYVKGSHNHPALIEERGRRGGGTEERRGNDGFYALNV